MEIREGISGRWALGHIRPITANLHLQITPEILVRHEIPLAMELYLNSLIWDSRGKVTTNVFRAQSTQTKRVTVYLVKFLLTLCRWLKRAPKCSVRLSESYSSLWPLPCLTPSCFLLHQPPSVGAMVAPSLPEDNGQCLETLLVVSLRFCGCSGHLLGGDQGCCSTPYTAQDSFLQQRIILPPNVTGSKVETPWTKPLMLSQHPTSFPPHS